jgi:hypothetical protein
LQKKPQSTASNAGSSTSTVTLGRSEQSTSTTLTTTTTNTTTNTTNTYAIDRFEEQHQTNDGTIYSRISSQELHPHPDARVSFYQARAANAIAAFSTAFVGAGPGN